MHGGGGLADDAVVRFGELDVPIRELVLVAEPEARRARVHLRVWHPVFRGMAKDARESLVFVLLDAWLGEDEVERWIGAIDVLDADPGQSPGRASAEAALVRVQAHRETGAVLEGRREDGAVSIATIDLGIKRIDHLDHDTHLEVVIALGPGHAMPSDAEAQELNAAEDALVARLGADAVHIGRETCAGERTIHFHVRRPRELEARIRAWTATQRWPITPRFRHDPGWIVLNRW